MKESTKIFLITALLLGLCSVLIYKGVEPIFVNNTVALPNMGNKLYPSPQPSLSPDNNYPSEASVSGVTTEDPEGYEVTEVIDGDTIRVNIEGREATIRLIGINTPETVDPRRSVECFGVEASNEAKRLLSGKKVILQKDVSETDRYGRLLRFVYLPLLSRELLFVNDYLVREGFAYASSYPPDISQSDNLNDAEGEARENNKGLWAGCK